MKKIKKSESELRILIVDFAVLVKIEDFNIDNCLSSTIAFFTKNDVNQIHIMLNF